ncbi:sushi, von Willebrand factor type A, EGF and pentraxin domain-containing protein 1-like isoform X1 [Sycon ciliatum]|uniref:sushi, von Willebrand factor type A, EGF and pentraxin domain-containing protein 1-like isoform X1 n=1 Tax=Sycon ciliatum TaxID=27933 RepID=UPI0031F66D67
MKFDICPNVTLSSTRWNIASERSTDAKGVVAEERFPVLLFQRTLPNLLVTCAERLRRALIQKVNKTSWIDYNTMLPVAVFIVLITTWMSVPASAATCSSTPNLSNGYYTTSISSFTNGGIAFAACCPGYQVNRPLTITCGNGTWPSGGSRPTCTSTTCSAAPPIANGYLTFNSRSFMDGGSTTANCFPGYQLNGTAAITCTSGQWPSNASLPTCTPLSTCPPLTVDNGDVSSGSGNLNNIHGVTCTSGFELMGNSIVICLDDGNWSSIPECVQSVECSSLTVANGQVSQGQNTVGSVRTVSCDDEYEPKSDRTIVCSVNGSWSSSPTCQATTTTTTTTTTIGTQAHAEGTMADASFLSQGGAVALIVVIAVLIMMLVIAVIAIIKMARRVYEPRRDDNVCYNNKLDHEQVAVTVDTQDSSEPPRPIAVYATPNKTTQRMPGGENATNYAAIEFAPRASPNEQ